MTTIRRPEPHELDRVLDLIADQQRDPARATIYLGAEPDGIRAELDDLDVDWRVSTLVAEGADGLAGAVLSDWDVELGRSWIHGPWARGDWLAIARPLLAAALETHPPEITAHEISADVAHTAMAELAREVGWTPTEVNHVYVVQAEATSAWPAEDPRVREARADDAAPIAPLHDQEFPDTYYSLDRILAGADAGEFIVGVAEDRGFLGYAVGRVQADGEGYLDFIAVTDEARRGGVGQALLASVGRRIVAAAPRGTINLTVQDHRTGARRLYERLGFTLECSMVGYRSPAGR